MDAFLAGVANVDLFVGDELFATAKTLTDSTFSFDVSLEDIRGGQGAKLYGKYAHSSTMDITLTDVMFRLEFIAKNIGSDIAIGGSALTVEEVTVTDAEYAGPNMVAEPTIVVRDGDKVLVKDKDYTVVLSQVKAGTAPGATN